MAQYDNRKAYKISKTGQYKLSVIEDSSEEATSRGLAHVLKNLGIQRCHGQVIRYFLFFSKICVPELIS